MTLKLIVEKKVEKKTKLKSFVGADDATENFYFLVSPDVLTEVRKTPLVLAHGVLVTNEVEAVAMLQHKEGASHIVCYIASDDAFENDLQPLKGHESFRESLAGTGFCRLELTNPAAKIYQFTANLQDTMETIIDVGHQCLGDDAPIQAVTARRNGALSVWKCVSEAHTGTLVAVSFEDQVIPFCVLPPGSDDMQVQEQVLLAEKFGVQMDFDTFEAMRMDGRLPSRSNFTTESLVVEQVRPQMMSSIRLKRVVSDILNRSKEFRGNVKDITVRGNDLTIKIARKSYKLKVKRDSSGLVSGVEFVWPKHRKGEMQDLVKKVTEAFKDASFKQVLEEATSGDNPRLVMLDYTRLDGGRRTRLVEPYSYRSRITTGRTYFYGWNVEEGGIRSYITDRIHGARRTDKTFKPRFLVEIGSAQRAAKKVTYPIQKNTPATVTKAVIKRAHERFDLKGGYGKIVRALGRAVKTPYKQGRERSEKKVANIKKKLGLKESVDVPGYETKREPFGDSLSFTIKAFFQGAEVGRIDVGNAEASDLSKHCREDLKKLIKKTGMKISLKTIALASVNHVEVHEDHRLKGVGKLLYVHAMKDAAKEGAILTQNQCVYWGNTSSLATRLWRSLSSLPDIIVSDGEQFAMHRSMLSEDVQDGEPSESATTKMDAFFESRYEDRFPKEMDWRDMGAWIRKNKLRDGFGRISDKEANHIAAAGDVWVLEEIPISSLTTKFSSDPDYKHKTPDLPVLVDQNNDVVDGRHRVGMARARGEETILAYVAKTRDDTP